MTQTTDLVLRLRKKAAMVDEAEWGWTLDGIVEEAVDEIERLRVVYDAARGLCYGADWNRGNHALLHGYRKKLIAAVGAIEPLPPGTC